MATAFYSFSHPLIRHNNRNNDPMLFQYWASVIDGGPTLKNIGLAICVRWSDRLAPIVWKWVSAEITGPRNPWTETTIYEAWGLKPNAGLMLADGLRRWPSI